jgi:hypothetical protein
MLTICNLSPENSLLALQSILIDDFEREDDDSSQRVAYRADNTANAVSCGWSYCVRAYDFGV